MFLTTSRPHRNQSGRLATRPELKLDPGGFAARIRDKAHNFSVPTPVPNKDTIFDPDAMKLDVVRYIFVMRCSLRRDVVASLPTA